MDSILCFEVTQRYLVCSFLKVFFSAARRVTRSRLSRMLMSGVEADDMSRVGSAAHMFSAVASALRMQLVKVMSVGMLVLYTSVHLLLTARSVRETCVRAV